MIRINLLERQSRAERSFPWLGGFFLLGGFLILATQLYAPRRAALPVAVPDPPEPPAAALEPVRRAEPPAAVVDLSRPAAVAGVATLPRGDQLEILLALEGAAEFDWFALEHPRRIVVDLTPARLDPALTVRRRPIAHPLANRIRIAQNRLDPPRVRLVVEVDVFPRGNLAAHAEGIRLRLSSP